MSVVALELDDIAHKVDAAWRMVDALVGQCAEDPDLGELLDALSVSLERVEQRLAVFAFRARGEGR